MLFVVFVYIRRVRHFRTVLNGHKIRVSDLFRHAAPDFRRMFARLFGPHAERYKQRLRLQSFAGMNGQNPDGVGGRGRDGFGMQRVVPISQEIRYVASVRAHVVARAI